LDESAAKRRTEPGYVPVASSSSSSSSTPPTSPQAAPEQGDRRGKKPWGQDKAPGSHIGQLLWMEKGAAAKAASEL